jgi:hypothetical protein
MNLGRDDLLDCAAVTGFPVETLDKAIRLLGLLQALDSHPGLTGRLALKGGTALNLFLSDLPRLSLDIDLNLVGDVERDRMLAARPRISHAICRSCAASSSRCSAATRLRGRPLNSPAGRTI